MNNDTLSILDNTVPESNKDLFGERKSIFSTKYEIALKVNGTLFESVFDNKGHIRYFSIIHGDINHMENNANNLQDLESLTLINNRGYVEITENSFKELIKLRELIIHLNHGVTLKENCLKSLVNLEVLSVDNQTYNEISNATIGNCRKLKYLSWSNGFLGQINPNTFQNLKNLVSITFKNVHLRTIAPKTFSDLPRLSILDLSDNKISKLLGHEFKLPSLEVLNLDRNLLISIDVEKIFENAPLLKILEVFHNKLSCKMKVKVYDFMAAKNITSVERTEVERCMYVDKIQIFSS
ncbi:hypothetical protein HHI36_009518 [Cryptolaemus montrouzieri]